MSESKETYPTPTKADYTAAKITDLMIMPVFRDARDAAFESADGDGELYATWRQNADIHLGTLAAALVTKKGASTPEILWEQQRQVALANVEGIPIGPFADFFFDLKTGGRAAEVEPASGDISHLPRGEYDVVATNNRITGLARDEDDAFTFFGDALNYLAVRRRQGGSKFEGPENYASTIKFFSDKSRDITFDAKSKQNAARMTNECMSRFLHVAERDEPNVVEMTNVLSAIKHLPQGVFDKRLSEGILKHTLATLDDFSQEGLNLLMSAAAKLDVSDCGEVAAMTIDLALRKGQRFERSGDMLASLRAVANLPHSSASERAFRSLLDTRSSLEVASSVDDLESTIKLLKQIIETTSEDPTDTVRVKGIANFIAHQAVNIYKQDNSSSAASPAELSAKLQQVKRIVDTAKKI